MILLFQVINLDRELVKHSNLVLISGYILQDRELVKHSKGI